MVITARRTLAGIFLFVASATVGFFPTAAADSLPRNPHEHFKTPEMCVRCHGITHGEPDPGRFLAESETLCLECHRKENLGRTHPVNVRPGDRYGKMKIPADFRLDEDGRMMCLTCHTAHGPYLSPTKAFRAQTPENTPSGEAGYRYKTFFLRRTSPDRGFEALCDACHGKP